MSDDAQLRAGDQDRDRAIARLRAAFSEGRISSEEFAQRQAKAQSALTYGELDGLVADLPGAALAPAATPAPAPVPATDYDRDVERGGDGFNRNAWGSWVGVAILVNAIWLVSFVTAGDGAKPYYWPIWVMVPWGAAILVTTITRRGRH